MKLLYCGFNYFDQILLGREVSLKKHDVLSPIQIFETHTDINEIDVFLEWSKMIISCEEGVLLRGFWKNTDGFNDKICDNTDIGKVVSTRDMIVGIGKDGRLKKLTTSIKDSFTWETVLTDNVGTEEAPHPPMFSKIASNEHTVLALDASGELFMPPTKLENVGAKFVDIACGKEHFIALTIDGSVYTWGSGSRGQLGHGTVDCVDYPMEVEALGGVKIKQISAGGWHNCALSECGDIYVWGWNESGQLGLPCRDLSGSGGDRRVGAECVSVQCEPRLLDNPAPFTDGNLNVTSVSCGARHTAVTLDDKCGWSWGWNGCGQLGIGDRRSRDAPVCVIQDVGRVICGAWSTTWLTRMESE